MRTRTRNTVVLILAALLVLAGCTSGGAGPRPGVPDAEVSALTTALAKGTLDGVPLVDAAGAQDDLTAALGSMNEFPTVTSSTVTVDQEGAAYIATADLTVTWNLPGGEWTYETKAILDHDSEWKVRWSPEILHPQLTSATRLTRVQQLGDRGAVLDRNGATIAGLQDGYRVGLDKTFIPSTEWERSARRLAQVVGINEDAYVKKVLGYGPKAWVPAASIPGYAPPAGVYDVPGATADKATVYGPAADRPRTFAQPLVGIVGEATAAIIEKSEGLLVPGDVVGLSGLQLLYDEQLRGTPGVTVSLTARPAPKPSAGPSTPSTPTPGSGQSSVEPSETASETSTPTPPESGTPTPQPDVTLLEREAVAGTPLKLTLDVKAQAQAEQAIAASGQAALVAVNPSTGEILAAATTGAQESLSTQGRFPPGSTFKTVSALALLRAGLTAESTVQCSATTVVNGRTIKNYSDYPSSKLGAIPLRTAFAESCNTAFVSNQNKLSAGALSDAAGSLGVGIDYEPGFYSFWGQVPSPTEPVARAEAMIGQGEVLTSPLAMAAVASSVAAGKTIVPSLIPGKTVTPKGTPLTSAEAATLQSLMSAVVTEGSGTSLRGVVTGAKSGTAEWSDKGTLRTHAWMIGYKATSLAVSVFVAGGQSGTQTAGPVLSSFVKGMG
jgi:cell division protein FtsI/penicillin-binding protein 2